MPISSSHLKTVFGEVLCSVLMQLLKTARIEALVRTLLDDMMLDSLRHYAGTGSVGRRFASPADDPRTS